MLVTHAGLRAQNGDLAFEVAFRNLHTDAPRRRKRAAACKDELSSAMVSLLPPEPDMLCQTT